MGNIGQVFPYDSDTVFLATLRDDTDSEQGVSPSTETLVTQRADGKYFGCHSIDVAATNLLADGNCEGTKPTLNSQNADTDLTSSLSSALSFEGAQSLKCVVPSGVATTAYFTLGAADSLNGLSLDSTYTFTAYVYVPSGRADAVKLAFISGSIADPGITYSSDSDKFGVWQRLSVTRLVDSGPPADECAYLRIDVQQDENEAQHIYVDGFQLEENTYHTAFVNTSRASDSQLYYATADITDMDYEKCTISFWFYYRPYDATGYNAHGRYLFSCQNSGGGNPIFRCLFNKSGNVMRLSFQFVTAAGSTTCNLGDVEVAGEGWHHMAMAWDSDADTGFEGFLDFVSIGTEAAPKYPDSLPNRIHWGTATWGAAGAEMRIEDIRIDKVKRTQAEMTVWKAWYDSVGSWRGPSRSIPAAAATLIGCV